MSNDASVEGDGFGYSKIVDELWTEIMEVGDARGDVKAAEERLRVPAQQLNAAEQALADRHEQLAKRLAELNLAGVKLVLSPVLPKLQYAALAWKIYR